MIRHGEHEIANIILFYALVSVAQNLSVGGVLWFPDLTLPDSTWIMPISLGLINLLIVEVRLLFGKFGFYFNFFLILNTGAVTWSLSMFCAPNK